MLFCVILLSLYAATAHGQDFVCGYGLGEDEVTAMSEEEIAFYRSSSSADPIYVLPLFGKLMDVDIPSKINLKKLKNRDGGKTESSTNLLERTHKGSLAQGAPTLTIAPAPTHGHNTLQVRWTMPDTTGIPAIRGYRLETCSGHCKSFTSAHWDPLTLEATSQTLTGLTPQTQYFARVRASNAEGDGAWSAVQSAYTQAAPDSPPVLTGDRAPHIDENQTAVPGDYTATDPDGDLISWSLQGLDADAFELVGADTTRTLQFKAAPDFEQQQTYSVTVQVASSPGEGEGGGGGVQTDTLAVTVSVDNVDEVGWVTLPSTGPVVGTRITAQLIDADGSITEAQWQWQRKRPSSTMWTAVPAQAGGTNESPELNNYTPTDADRGHVLRATVTSYRDAFGAGKRAESAATGVVTGPPDPPPTIAGDPAPEVEENTTRVGEYTATDADGDPITWLALTGEHASAFVLGGSITDATRTLRFTDAAVPNFEQQITYHVTLRVQSSSVSEGSGAGDGDGDGTNGTQTIAFPAFKEGNRERRIVKKVFVGSVSGAVFSTTLKNGLIRLLQEDDDDEIDTEKLFDLNDFKTAFGGVFGLFLGNMFGSSIGVTLADSHDSFRKTLPGGVVGGLGGLCIRVLSLSSDSEVLTNLGVAAFYAGPLIGSIIASEVWRKSSQDRRISFGLSPNLNGGFSAFATLRFNR